MEKIEKEKECWELFSVPRVVGVIGNNKEDIPIVKTSFYCEKTNHSINVYRPENEDVDNDTISKVMKTALSICLHCTGTPPLSDSGYIVQ